MTDNMITFRIDEKELLLVNLIRLALSEDDMTARVRSIKNVKYFVSTISTQIILDFEENERFVDHFKMPYLRYLAKISERSHDATYELAEVQQRYEARNDTKLNIAEHVGRYIWNSIESKKFEGLHTEIGILQQVQREARAKRVAGARDKDVLRKIWSTYRGVVHLGMAMDYCEENPDHDMNVLQIAESYRRTLSDHCPKGTSKPYVSADEQIKFIYSSTL